ncbi:MAG: ABC transporter ATP-binding protein [Saprospiraceae bacterium]
MNSTEAPHPMRRLFAYLKNYRTQLNWAIFNSIINKIVDLMPPFLTAWVIDSVSGNTPAWISNYLGISELWSVIIFLIILTIVVHVGESLTEWLYQLQFRRLAQIVQHDLRLQTYNQLQSRELGYFEEQRTGNLMAMLNDDVNQLERFLNTSFKEIIHIIVLVICAGASLILVEPWLGSLSLLPIPFIVWGSYYYQRKIAPHYREVRNNVGELSNRLENNISGMPVIKSFTAEQYESERVATASADYRDANFKAIRWNALYNPVIRMFVAFSFAASLLIGAYWVIYEPGRFTIGSLAFFAMMIQRLLWPVTRLGGISDEYERARAAARRIFGLLDTTSKINDPVQPQILPASVGHFSLKNIHFAYQDGQPIFEHLNLEIPAQQTIGIAGQTGGGKTSLIKLLLRFYDVDSGEIKLEGINIKNLKISDLRENIGLVSQDVYLFHGSFRENIAYAMPHLSDPQIIAAAQRAQLHEFITSLPQGYDTIIGERGIKLSGGQRQRLSIARAILKDAPILILDEATSAVDTETERAIQRNLNELTHHKTAIIIAHRLSTIRRADKIVVIGDGGILEEGTHDGLLQTDGVYADLWRVQTGEL